MLLLLMTFTPRNLQAVRYFFGLTFAFFVRTDVRGVTDFDGTSSNLLRIGRDTNAILLPYLSL